MGVALLSAASGLNKADQQTVKDWMIEGHSIMNGKVVGTAPDRTDSGVNLDPGETWTIPRGYYDGTGVVKAGNKGVVSKISQAVLIGPIPHATYNYNLTFDFSDVGGYQNFTTNNFTGTSEAATSQDGNVNRITIAGYNTSTGVLSMTVQTFRSDYGSTATFVIWCTCTI